MSREAQSSLVPAHREGRPPLPFRDGAARPPEVVADSRAMHQLEGNAPGGRIERSDSITPMGAHSAAAAVGTAIVPRGLCRMAMSASSSKRTGILKCGAATVLVRPLRPHAAPAGMRRNATRPASTLSLTAPHALFVVDGALRRCGMRLR